MLSETTQDTLDILFRVCDDTTNNVAELKLHINDVLDLLLWNRYREEGYRGVVITWVASNLVQFDHKAESGARLNDVNFHSVLVE